MRSETKQYYFSLCIIVFVSDLEKSKTFPHLNLAVKLNIFKSPVFEKKLKTKVKLVQKATIIKQ